MPRTPYTEANRKHDQAERDAREASLGSLEKQLHHAWTTDEPITPDQGLCLPDSFTTEPAEHPDKQLRRNRRAHKARHKPASYQKPTDS